jgi:hypothetical protein
MKKIAKNNCDFIPRALAVLARQYYKFSTVGNGHCSINKEVEY